MIEYKVTDGFCVLRLDLPPVNTLTFELLEKLCVCIENANENPGVSGIVITGSPNHFSSGADVGMFREISTADEAKNASRIFQDAFQEVENSNKPVVAAVSGQVMGGALELAMACHYRVCDSNTVFSTPEVNLGINPGAGGTQRLPRLIGLKRALPMMLTANPVKADEALEMGLVDAVCDTDQLLNRALQILKSGSEPVKTGSRTDKIHDKEENAAAFENARDLAARVRPELIAPVGIIKAVETGLHESLQAGMLMEQEIFAQCMATPATRNKIYVFFATSDTAKIPDLADVKPGRISQAAAIGMGSMGTGIAHALIIGGVPVIARDEEQSFLDKSVGRITRSIEKRVESGKMTRARANGMLALLSTTTDWRDIADADLVIEAVFEDIQVKHAVIKRIEETCSADTIIASNTSTISLDTLAEGMQNPERLIGMHFFNPAQTMPLVEIIRRDKSPAEIIMTALKFARQIRKTPVLVKNREGFIVNRMFIPYLKEAFRLLEDGANPTAIDRAMVDFGMAMGPLTLIDMAGIDILVSVDEVMNQAFPTHGELSSIAVQLVENGAMGQKTGAGVYKYENGDRQPHDSEDTARIIAEVREEMGKEPREVDSDEITQRLILRMVNEGFFIMQEGIAQRESDLDAAMVLGTGFPDFRGGVMKYARDVGLDNVITRLDKLSDKFGERFLPCEYLRDQKGQ
ncbi:MAG: enoyl-CoA hydratase/isomerase family protein [Pontiellaceae bacterium]|nr:enoyl-CoA hydratase/isomerase family protein [Pontiellaceae bacterium]